MEINIFLHTHILDFYFSIYILRQNALKYIFYNHVFSDIIQKNVIVKDRDISIVYLLQSRFFR